MPLTRAEARSYLSNPEATCLICGHSENDHPSGACDYFDESDDGNDIECTCDDFQLFDAQPMDVVDLIPEDATLDDLRLLAKIATQDGRLIPVELSREIARLSPDDDHPDGYTARELVLRLQRELDEMPPVRD